MPETKKFHLPDAQYIDKTFWALYIILIFVATVALSSSLSTLVYKGGSMSPLLSQMQWMLVGVICAFGMQYVPSKFIRMGGYVLLAASCMCLYLMLIPRSPFVSEINGAGRWFKLGGFSFQPSEMAKLALIIVVGDQLSRIKKEEDKKRYFFITLGITAFVVLPILVGNLSTAILLAGIVFLMWFLARIPWKYLLSIAAIAIGVLVSGYFIVEVVFIKPGRPLPKLLSRASTWVSRIDDMIAEKQVEEGETFVLNDDNYQRSMAKVAIARGGTSPIGVLPGNSQERDHLPLAYADYIFAIIVEETGVIGAIGLIFLYLAVLFRACWTSSRYEDYAAIFMVMGLALMLTGQALISMMVAVGIGPVTGQPLPLISKGGTSVIITSLYFGIMMAVSREQAKRKGVEVRSMEQSWDEVPEIEIEDE